MALAMKDLVATAQQRLGANCPELALNLQALHMRHAQVILSAIADVSATVDANQQDASIDTATSNGLAVLANNNGVQKNSGSYATVSQVQVSVQQAPPPGQTYTLKAGTIISTGGNDTTSPALGFATNADLVIANPATTSNIVAATAQQPGSAYNVAVGAITTVNLPLGQVNLFTITNLTAGAGGLDGDTDDTLRAGTKAAIKPKYSKSQIESAILAVPGVYDAYVYDPQDGSRLLAYAWCDQNGATPGLTGASTIPASGALTTTTPTIAAGTLAASVDAAVLAVLPPGTGSSPSNPIERRTFVVVNYTSANAVPVTYSAPAAMQNATFTTPIQNAVAAYIQGQMNGAVPVARSGLIHGQVPQVAGANQMYEQVQAALSGVLTNFTLGTTTPAIGSAAANTIYRLTGTPASVVQVTRV